MINTINAGRNTKIKSGSRAPAESPLTNVAETQNNNMSSRVISQLNNDLFVSIIKYYNTKNPYYVGIFSEIIFYFRLLFSQRLVVLPHNDQTPSLLILFPVSLI